MGFGLGENQKSGEVTQKPQVLSRTQLLPFNASFSEVLTAFWLVPVCEPSGRSRPGVLRERGPRGAGFIFIILKSLLCAEL